MAAHSLRSKSSDQEGLASKPARAEQESRAEVRTRKDPGQRGEATRALPYFPTSRLGSGGVEFNYTLRLRYRRG
ncbi:hypothetical protein PVAG01_04082 [Phlyctema vagabunda]|uniref:Uncharacterized protein n=1 Tax=Phlyctema vagabunda TaxID=108571 RepID=A0ABR4PN98_9HELO